MNVVKGCVERIERCCSSRCCVAKSGALLGIAPWQSDVQTSPSNRVVAESCCCAVASLHAFKSWGENVNTFYLIILIVLAFGGVSVLIRVRFFFLRDFLRMLSDCYLSLVAAATYRWWMPANWSLRIQTVLAGSALASIKFDSEADEIATSLVFIFTVSQREFPRKLQHTPRAHPRQSP